MPLDETDFHPPDRPMDLTLEVNNRPVALTIESSVAMKMSDYASGRSLDGATWIQALSGMLDRRLVTALIPATFLHDKEADKDKARAGSDWLWARSVGILPVPARMDESFLDDEFVYVLDKEDREDLRLDAIALRGRSFTGDARKDKSLIHDQRDFDQLVAHRHSSQEFFLTRDTYALKPLVRKAILQQGPRIITVDNVVVAAGMDSPAEIRAYFLAVSDLPGP